MWIGYHDKTIRKRTKKNLSKNTYASRQTWSDGRHTLPVVEGLAEALVRDLGQHDLRRGDARVLGQRLAQVPNVGIHRQGEADPHLPRRLVQVEHGNNDRSHLNKRTVIVKA